MSDGGSTKRPAYCSIGEKQTISNQTLTKRQIAVVRGIAADLTSKEIAAQLHISTKMVEFHKHKIKAKLRTRGPAAIVRYAIREGIIEP